MKRNAYQITEEGHYSELHEAAHEDGVLVLELSYERIDVNGGRHSEYKEEQEHIRQRFRHGIDGRADVFRVGGGEGGHLLVEGGVILGVHGQLAGGIG